MAAGTAKVAHGVYRRLAGWHGELTAFRRDLHAHPELGFEEKRTAARVAEALRVAGVDEVHEGIGRTGVVGVVRGARAGAARETRMLGLRADMDALPILEENDFAWRSATRGLMHGCGHDGHTTMLVADLPAWRRGLRRRQGDDRRRPVRAFPG